MTVYQPSYFLIFNHIWSGASGTYWVSLAASPLLTLHSFLQYESDIYLWSRSFFLDSAGRNTVLFHAPIFHCQAVPEVANHVTAYIKSFVTHIHKSTRECLRHVRVVLFLFFNSGVSITIFYLFILKSSYSQQIIKMRSEKSYNMFQFSAALKCLYIKRPPNTFSWKTLYLHLINLCLRICDEFCNKGPCSTTLVAKWTTDNWIPQSYYNKPVFPGALWHWSILIQATVYHCRLCRCSRLHHTKRSVAVTNEARMPTCTQPSFTC